MLKAATIDGSKFKAVNNRDRNFTEGTMKRRMAQIVSRVAPVDREDQVSNVSRIRDQLNLHDGYHTVEGGSRNRNAKVICQHLE